MNVVIYDTHHLADHYVEVQFSSCWCVDERLSDRYKKVGC